MQALRRRTAQAIVQIERRQKRQSVKKSAIMRGNREAKERLRNEVVRKNRLLVKQQVWEEHYLGELKSSEGWLSNQRKRITRDLDMSQWEKNQQKRLRTLQSKLTIAREDLLLEREERRKMPENHVTVSSRRCRATDRAYNDSRCVQKGDRIAIKATDGPCARYRGQIGTVIAVNKQRRVCVVEGMTIVSFPAYLAILTGPDGEQQRQARAPKDAPLYTLFSEPSYDPEHLVLLPIPFSHMRMVRTVLNDAGEKEDVILGHLTPQDLIAMGQKEKAYEIERSRFESPGRTAAKVAKAKAAEQRTTKAFIPDESETEDTKLAREQTKMGQTQGATNKEPGRLTKLYNRLTGKKPPEEKDKYEDFVKDDPTTPSDTLRLDIDTPSWTPTLLRAPLPGTIIDELRGKYSKFRTRHDPDFVKRMQRIDSEKQSRERLIKSGGEVLDTPRKEAMLSLQAQRRDERVKRGPLNEKALEGIGRLMWERGMRLDPIQEIEVNRRRAKEQRKQLGGAVADLVAAGHTRDVGESRLGEVEAR